MPPSVCYRYAKKCSSYENLLASVEEIEPDTALVAKQKQELAREQPVIDAISDTIRAGTCKKMELAIAVMARVPCSRGQALDILEKYTGPDGLWQFKTRARGAKVYVLNESPAEREIGRKPGELET